MHGNLLVEFFSVYKTLHGRAVAQQIDSGLSPRKPGFNLRSVLAGILVEKEAL